MLLFKLLLILLLLLMLLLFVLMLLLKLVNVFIFRIFRREKSNDDRIIQWIQIQGKSLQIVFSVQEEVDLAVEVRDLSVRTHLRKE